jgi:hypothetical protein
VTEDHLLGGKLLRIGFLPVVQSLHRMLFPENRNRDDRHNCANPLDIIAQPTVKKNGDRRRKCPFFP